MERERKWSRRHVSAVGLDLRTLRWQSEIKPRVRGSTDSATQAPFPGILFIAITLVPQLKDINFKHGLSHKHKFLQCFNFGHPFIYSLVSVRKVFKRKLLIDIIYVIITFFKGFIKINLELFLNKLYKLHT